MKTIRAQWIQFKHKNIPANAPNFKCIDMMKQGKIEVDLIVNKMLGSTIKSKQVAEIVASDGRFISIYERKAINDVMAMDADPTAKLVKLIASLIKIDGERATIEEVMDLNCQDFNKVIETVAPFWASK